MIRKPEMTKTYHGAFSGKKRQKLLQLWSFFCHDERTGQSGCVYTEYTKIEATFAGRMHDRVLSRTEEMGRSPLQCSHLRASLLRFQGLRAFPASPPNASYDQWPAREQDSAPRNRHWRASTWCPPAAAACKSIYFGCYDQFSNSPTHGLGNGWDSWQKNERRLSPALNWSLLIPGSSWFVAIWFLSRHIVKNHHDEMQFTQEEGKAMLGFLPFH